MRISTATTKDGGFSLIEILVVIGLMALITGVFVPSFTSIFRLKGEGVARKIALMMGEARDRALLADKLIRLKVDFTSQTLTLEEASSRSLVPRPKEGSLTEREKEELARKEAEAFRPVSEIMKKPLKLPEGLRIIQVSSPRYKKPVTEGIATVYFFSNGSTDGATLYFETDERVKQAVVLHPVTGLSRLEAKGPEGS